ncbi:MAG: L-2-hydroxyglutarate oxidase [Leptospiraceae bacterium]|nr:L-2-hydroxyglutarate oxidase [Leptospiraceae bacterium]
MLYDYIISGAGIIGLSTAYRILEKFPNKKILILEKENSFALHQTGRNSGVIHSGIYYKPGSLKAINCREGKLELEKFCKENKVNFEICGKVIVAVTNDELERLELLYQRGKQNGILCEMISKEKLKKIEPHVNGLKAIFVNETGIVDYIGFCAKLIEKISSSTTIKFGERVINVNSNDKEALVETPNEVYTGLNFINCSGIYSDRIAGITDENQMIPFRGEYYQLTKEAEHLCKNLIYPVPNPEFPFLGVHFTRMIGGGVECGPNAVLALGREAYNKTDWNFTDLREMIQFKGFRKIIYKYWQTGLGELHRSISKSAFVKALQRLIPEIESKHLVPIDPGIRAQLVSREGSLVDDFMIIKKNREVHVVNAPSPAATSSLNIGKYIVDNFL